MERLDEILERIRVNFAEKYKARDKALQDSRDIIRYSANAIRAAHRRDFAAAHNLVQSAKDRLDRIKADLVSYEDIYYAGFVQDAEKEYAEAAATLALLEGDPLPDPDDLAVSYVAYLNGLGEVVGELRRYVLDAIRRREAAIGEQALAAMDDIYGGLVTIDFPDGMTGDLRRTTDAARGILERTRGDLTMALSQSELEVKLREFEKRL